jgi:oligosaccharide reducing-end xylanase
VNTIHPETGLSPDYADFDGSPWGVPWRLESVEFQTDAWRTAMNWSFDWAWWAKDPRQCELSNRLQRFFESQGMDDYVSYYTMDGKPASNNQSTGLVAMNAVASLAAMHPRSEQFVKALWETPVPTGRYRYYDGMLYMLGMLHCSGNFRIWKPVVPNQDSA